MRKELKRIIEINRLKREGKTYMEIGDIIHNYRRKWEEETSISPPILIEQNHNQSELTRPRYSWFRSAIAAILRFFRRILAYMEILAGKRTFD